MVRPGTLIMRLFARDIPARQHGAHVVGQYDAIAVATDALHGAGLGVLSRAG